MIVSEKINIQNLLERYKTPNGIYILEGSAANAGVLPYTITDTDGESIPTGIFTAPYTLFESSQSLIGVPVTVEHTDGATDIDMQGIVLDAYPVDEFRLGVKVALWGDNVLQYIKDGNYELSAGYNADVIDVNGEWFGSPYSKEKRNIVYDHLAVVKAGTARNGTNAKLIFDTATTTIKSSMLVLNFKDSADTKIETFEQLTMGKYINIPNHKTQFQVPEEVADYIETLCADLNKNQGLVTDSVKQTTQLTELKTLLETTQTQLYDSKSKVVELTKEVEQTKKQLPYLMSVASKAEKLGVEIDFDKFDPTSVMKLAIKDKYPNTDNISDDTLSYLFSITDPVIETETEEKTKTESETLTDSRSSKKPATTSLKTVVSNVKTESKRELSPNDLADSVAAYRKRKKEPVVRK